MFSRDTEVLAFMRRMIAGNEQRNDRNTKIFYKQRFVKYPFENGLSDLPPEDRFFCINEFVKTLSRSRKGNAALPANFREWIYYTFGKGIAECYMVPYNEKIWKFPTEQMSLHWVDGRIPRPPVEDVIKSAIGIETEGYTHQSVFSYPLDGGIEALVHGNCPSDPSLYQNRVQSIFRKKRRDRHGRSAMAVKQSKPTGASARCQSSTFFPAWRMSRIA